MARGKKGGKTSRQAGRAISDLYARSDGVPRRRNVAPKRQQPAGRRERYRLGQLAVSAAVFAVLVAGQAARTRRGRRTAPPALRPHRAEHGRLGCVLRRGGGEGHVRIRADLRRFAGHLAGCFSPGGRTTLWRSPARRSLCSASRTRWRRCGRAWRAAETASAGCRRKRKRPMLRRRRRLIPGHPPPRLRPLPCPEPAARCKATRRRRQKSKNSAERPASPAFSTQGKICRSM
jgi:hypothetical protein